MWSPAAKEIRNKMYLLQITVDWSHRWYSLSISAFLAYQQVQDDVRYQII